MITLPPAVSVLLQMFGLLFSNRWIDQWQQSPAGPVGKKKAGRRFYQRIYSLRVTLWYLIYQRLNFDPALAAVVTDVRRGGADRLGRRGRKLSSRVRSTKTSAYSQARQRLPLALLEAALAHLGTLLCKQAGCDPAPRRPPGPASRTRQLLDGSTLSILATPELAREFPPACNQKGPSDWCLMRILVGFCARSGAILSAISGPVQHSEQALAWILMARAQAFTLWIGDRNFGVWSVVAQAIRHRQDVVVRLTKTRARKLCAGRPLASGEDRAVQWKPSRHDQAAPGTARTAVAGRLIYVRLKKAGRYIDLWLFTTLPADDYPVALLVAWYGQRWQAELHFRSVKTQLKMSELDVGTAAMARKEFYAGLLAYSLVRAVMWSAGERLETGIKALSFSQARRILQTRLQDWGRRLSGDTSQWAQEIARETAQHTLPKRRKPRRSEVRRVRHRRQKFPPLKGSRALARRLDRTTKSL